MKKLLLLLLLTACSPKHETMPPGFHLICNAKGQFAAQRNEFGHHGQIVESWRTPTKQNAIDRAWSQYEYELPEPKPTIDPKQFDTRVPFGDCD